MRALGYIANVLEYHSCCASYFTPMHSKPISPLLEQFASHAASALGALLTAAALLAATEVLAVRWEISSLVRPGVIVLPNGQALAGDLQQDMSGDWLITTPSGDTRTIPVSEPASLTFTGPGRERAPWRLLTGLLLGALTAGAAAYKTWLKFRHPIRTPKGR